MSEVRRVIGRVKHTLTSPLSEGTTHGKCVHYRQSQNMWAVKPSPPAVKASHLDRQQYIFFQPEGFCNVVRRLESELRNTAVKSLRNKHTDSWWRRLWMNYSNIRPRNAVTLWKRRQISKCWRGNEEVGLKILPSSVTAGRLSLNLNHTERERPTWSTLSYAKALLKMEPKFQQQPGEEISDSPCRASPSTSAINVMSRCYSEESWEHAGNVNNGEKWKEWLRSLPVITSSPHAFGIRWLSDIFICKERKF